MSPMTVQRVFRLCVALLLVLCARLSPAQVLTGTLVGTVEDQTGGQPGQDRNERRTMRFAGCRET